MVEVSKEMLEEKNMPKIYWAEAIQMTLYIYNQISATGAKVSQHELYFRQKLNSAHIRMFDNIAIVYIPNER